MKKIIPYGKQSIKEEDLVAVKQALKKDKITTGLFVSKFENFFRSYTGSKYALSCNSGTSALYLAFKALNLLKDEIVIMPSITFVSSYSVAKMFDAKVYLTDVDPLTGQMTPEHVLECCQKFKIKKIKILVIMYHSGYPLNADRFKNIKKKFNCYLVEDSCHALGASYYSNNKTYKIGSCMHSDISTFSFHPVKSITTGEGGAITTNNKKIFNKLTILRSIGVKRSKDHWDYDVEELSLNFRLTDFQCALGLSQLKRLNKFIKKRKEISKLYNKEFVNNNYFYFVEHQKKFKSSNHLYFLKLFQFNLKKKNQFIRYMKSKNIYLQYHYKPIYRFKIFTDKYIGKNAEKFYNNTISLPIYFDLKLKEQLFVIKSIKEFFNK